jgi:hypothetical protein
MANRKHHPPTATNCSSPSSNTSATRPPKPCSTPSPTPPTTPAPKPTPAISAAWQLIFDDPRKGRVLFIEAAGNTTLREQRQQTWINSAQILSAIIRDYLGGNNAEPGDLQLTALSLVGAQTELAAAYLDGHLDMSPERIINHIVELLRRPRHLRLNAQGFSFRVVAALWRYAHAVVVKGRKFQSATLEAQVVLALGDSDVVLEGLAGAAERPLSVVGGTGTYEGARGSATEKETDGGAELTIRLLP